jgi:hypothetical protein
MISTLLTKLVSLVAIPVLFFTGVFAPEPVIQEPSENLGVALPSGTATFETSLASPMTAAATSMTLTSASVRGGTTLSGYQCFTIDEGSAQAEFVCGTSVGTAISGLERGLSPADGVTETASLKFSHRRGASVKITDFPLIQRLKSQASGGGTYESVLSYASGVTPVGGSELVDVEYVTSIITGTSTLSYNKTVVNGTAGETVATGSIVYLKSSDSRWYKADNDDTSTYVDQTLGIAQGPGTSGNSITNGVLTYGLDSTQKGMTGGNFIFLSATAGATSTATTSQVLGKAISATTMFFDQNLIDSSVYTATAFNSAVTFSATTTGIGKYEFYTASSTWTKPTGARIVSVCIVGGGGGGGGAGADNSASVYASGGGGGGGGGLSCKTFSANSLSTTVAITIGAGGAGGAGGATPINAGSNASAGTDTSFGAYLIAKGGSAGGGGPVNDHTTGGSAGAGGAGITETGGAGGAGTGANGASVSGFAPTGGGGGGGNITGVDGGNGGSRSVVTHTGGAGGSGDVEDPGSAGTAFISDESVGGTGGGGGEGTNNADAVNGGAGGAGTYGSGGGGGGSSHGGAGGAGGRGGNGIAVVITY